MDGRDESLSRSLSEGLREGWEAPQTASTIYSTVRLQVSSMCISGEERILNAARKLNKANQN